MSEFQRCLRRNIVLGAVAAFLCYIMYNPMLADIYPAGHTAFTYAMISSLCTTCFSMGLTAWTSDTDPPFFKYITSGIRITVPLTLLSASIGLLNFSWLGLSGGFVIGLTLSLLTLKLIGPDAATDKNCPQTTYDYQMFHYYCKALSTPLLTIPPLAFGGLLLFEWWGLGAGFIGGALISTVVLTLCAPKKPVQSELFPNMDSRQQRILPDTLPKTQHTPLSKPITSPIDIPTEDLDAVAKLDKKNRYKPQKSTYSKSI